MKKKAISPVITTILLILVAIVLALLILWWWRGIMKEQLTKFGEPINNACNDVRFTASISGEQLSISNGGDIPIYKFGIRIAGAGSSDIIYTEELNLAPGTSKTTTFPIPDGGTIDKLIPVLLGENKKGEVKEYNCPRSAWGTLE